MQSLIDGATEGLRRFTTTNMCTIIATSLRESTLSNIGTDVRRLKMFSCQVIIIIIITQLITRHNVNSSAK